MHKLFSNLVIPSIILLLGLIILPSQTHAWTVSDIEINPGGTRVLYYGGNCDSATLRTLKGHPIYSGRCSPSDSSIGFINEQIPNGTYYINVQPAPSPIGDNSEPFNVLNGELVNTPFPLPGYPETLPIPNLNFYAYQDENVLIAGQSACNKIDYDVYDENKQIVSHIGGCGGSGEIYVLDTPLPDGKLHVFANSFGGVLNNELHFLQMYSGDFYILNGKFYPNPPIIVPQINPVSDVTINEGSSLAKTVTFLDDDSNSWTAEVNFGDGNTQTFQLTNRQLNLNHVYVQNGIYDVDITITDAEENTSSTSLEVTVNNTAPSVTGVSGPTQPVAVNNQITYTASFVDAGALDTHTAVINWGDNSTSAGTISNGTVSGTHTYTTAGVYEINLTVTDQDGASGYATPFQYVAVYDVSAGWASGTKEYNSPVGAVNGSPEITGKVDFGFQVKYLPGDSVPTGTDVEFSFPAAGLEFISSGYEWITINGTKAILQATGSLNGNPGHTVLISGIDQGTGQAKGLVRIRIKNGSTVIYDTQPGAADTADPTTSVSKGKISVH